MIYHADGYGKAKAKKVLVNTVQLTHYKEKDINHSEFVTVAEYKPQVSWKPWHLNSPLENTPSQVPSPNEGEYLQADFERGRT